MNKLMRFICGFLVLTLLLTAFPVFAQDVAGEEPDLWLWDGFVTVVGEPIYVESKENRIPEDAVLVYAHTDGTQVSVPATKSEATGNCFFSIIVDKAGIWRAVSYNGKAIDMDSLQFKAYASGDDYIKEEEEKFQKASDAVKRIEGANRYETALALSEQWDVSDYAVLASGEDFPDAMFGGPLATQVDAPMLLTKKAALYPGILPRLEALGVKTVYLLGGEEAVSPAVMDTLQEAGYRVVRVGGKNRMETAERSSELAAELRGDEAVNDKIRFEVNRNAYADALAGGAFVAMHREKFGSSYFVPYVGKDGSIVFGGTEVVPSIPNEIRLAGNNRYATAVEIAKAYKTMLDKEIKRVVLVNGENFPDGLAATPFAFRKDAVVLLTKQNELPMAVDAYLREHAIQEVWLIGGPEAITEDQQNYLAWVLKDNMD